MPKFTYKAKKGPTEVVEGEIDAENEDAALAKISGLGLIPIKIQPDGSASERKPSPKKIVSAASSRKTDEKAEPKVPLTIDRKKVRVSHRDLNIFTRQFSILLKANVQLLRSFEVLEGQTGNVKFREVLKQIKTALREGASLSEALEEFPKIFNQIYVSLIHSGEVSGTLDKVLMRLSEFAERDAEVRSKVKSALVYPSILFLVGVGTIFVLLTFVMPRLMVVFEDLGTELPEITQFMLNVSGFCQDYWMWMFGAIAALILYLRSVGLSKGQKRALDKIVIKLPVVGKLIEKSEISKFLRSLELYM